LEADGAADKMRRLASEAVAAVGGDAAAVSVAVSVTVSVFRAAVLLPLPPSVRLVSLFPRAHVGHVLRHPHRHRLEDPEDPDF